MKRLVKRVLCLLGCMALFSPMLLNDSARASTTVPDAGPCAVEVAVGSTTSGFHCSWDVSQTTPHDSYAATHPLNPTVSGALGQAGANASFSVEAVQPGGGELLFCSQNGFAKPIFNQAESRCRWYGMVFPKDAPAGQGPSFLDVPGVTQVTVSSNLYYKDLDLQGQATATGRISFTHAHSTDCRGSREFTLNPATDDVLPDTDFHIARLQVSGTCSSLANDDLKIQVTAAGVANSGIQSSSSYSVKEDINTVSLALS